MRKQKNQHQKMPDRAGKIPAALVDKNNGKIHAFETWGEWAAGNLAPTAGRYLTLAARLAIIPGTLFITPTLFLARTLYARYINRELEKEGRNLLAKNTLDRTNILLLDLRTKDGCTALNDVSGRDMSAFVEGYLKMAKDAGLKTPPYLEIAGDKTSEKYEAAFSYSLPGKKPLLVVGAGLGFLRETPMDEIAAVVGHEMTHLRLNHSQDALREGIDKKLSRITNAALVLTGLIHGIPLLPVVGVILATSLADRCFKSMLSRYHEKTCDRGSTLLTGDGAALSRALVTIKQKIMARRAAAPPATKEKFQERLYTTLRRARRILLPKKSLRMFIFNTYPTLKQRTGALARFDEKNPLWCRSRKTSLLSIFNKKATGQKSPDPRSFGRNKPETDEIRTFR